MKVKIQITTIILILITLILSACNEDPSKVKENPLNMANPASVFCEEQGGRIEMREDEHGQYGVCVFPDGSECEEWAHLRGDCKPSSIPDEITLGSISMNVIAIYGSVISSGSEDPSPSKLVSMPESYGSIYIVGQTDEVNAQILGLRDKPMPNNKANFWGQLECETKDNCLLEVSKVRVDGPGELPAGEMVEGWEGVLYNGPAGPRSGGDDYFALLGQLPLQYGIDGVDEGIRLQLEELRDTGQAFKIWGQIFAGRMDWNAAQIIVSKIELIPADASEIPPAPKW